jgi:hypothetical protein
MIDQTQRPNNGRNQKIAGRVPEPVGSDGRRVAELWAYTPAGWSKVGDPVDWPAGLMGLGREAEVLEAAGYTHLFNTGDSDRPVRLRAWAHSSGDRFLLEVELGDQGRLMVVEGLPALLNLLLWVQGLLRLPESSD